MTQAAKAQEPTMEEILASIRRIIADDDASKPAKTTETAARPKQQPAVTAAPSRPAPPAAPAKTAPPPPSPKPAPGFRTIDGASDVVFSTGPDPQPHPQLDRALISNETIAAVDSAFNTLAHTIIGQNARTLEDLVKEMLRPMLKSWLDDNLPSMVERIVRAEIERVSRGRP
jgi:cell pole-organizing protein PopZ